MTGPAKARWVVLAQIGLMIGLRIGGAAASLGFTMLLARKFGPVVMGEIATIIAMAMVLAVFCTTNIEAGGLRFLVRYLAAGRPEAARGYVLFARRYVARMSVVVLGLGFGVLALRAGGWPGLGLMAGLAAAGGLGWIRLNAGLAMGLNRVLLASAPRSFFRPMLMLMAVALWLWLVPDAAPGAAPAIAAGLFMATVFIAGAGQHILVGRALRGVIPADAGQDLSAQRDWLRIGLTIGANILYLEYWAYLAVLIGAAVMAPADLGRFDVLLKVLGFFAFSLSAVDQVFAPRISRAIAEDNRDRLAMLLGLSAAGKLLIWGVGFGLLSLLGTQVLSLFGPEFAPAAGLLLFLMLDPLLALVFGPAAKVLAFSNRQNILLPVLGATLVVLGLGGAVLGSAFGPAGAVASVIAARATWAISLAFFARRRLGIDTTVLTLPRYLLSRRTEAR